MRPKGKLFALVVMFAAVGLLTATGAFTTVQADRTATVQTADDASALLALEPAQNSEFATANNGQVEISLNDTATASPDPGGVNRNATTLDDNTINITNNGQEDVVVFISNVQTTNNADIYFYNSSDSAGQVSTIGDSTKTLSQAGLASNTSLSGDKRYLINASNANANKGIELASGDTVEVGIMIETYGSSTDEIFQNNEITINAVESSEIDTNSV